MAFEGGDIASAKAPLAALFEGRQDIAPREFVDGIRAEVQEKRDLARIQQDIVLLSHDHSGRCVRVGF